MFEKNFFLLALRDELIAIKELFLENKLIFTLIFIVFIGGLYFIDPVPGKNIRIAVAGQDSGYSLIAKKFTSFLAKEGVKLELEHTSSSIQNAKAVAQSLDGVNAAFIQGGILTPELADQIQSLGSVDFEPVWIFYRKDLANKVFGLGDLSKLRVGVGPSQSGTWIISKKLFMLGGIDITLANNFIVGSYENNLNDLLAGKLDAVINVNPVIDPVVTRLLHDPGIQLLDLKQTAAYDIQLPFVKEVKLPAFSIDIEHQIPPKDISMLTTTTTLAVNKDMHPGLQIMLLMAVKDALRGSRTLFLNNVQKFPVYVDSSIPISAAASEYYDYGVPQVMRYLPFWLAGIIDRLWVYILGLLAIVVPLSQLNINLRSIRFKLRIERIQREILTYERDILYGTLSPEGRIKILSRVQTLINFESTYRIPTGCESDYLNLLEQLSALRDKLA